MLSLDASLIVVFFIVWILVAVLTRAFFNPIRRTVGKGDMGIERDTEASQKAIESYEGKLQEIEENLSTAKAAAREKRESLIRHALTEKERMLAEVSQECRAKIQKTKEELEKEAERLKEELIPESKKLAERIEQRLIH